MSNIFWSNIFRQPSSQLQTVADLWQKTPLFAAIPKKQISFLCSKMHIRQYAADEVIFRQGDQGAGAILVLSGAARIMADKNELALLGPGDFFGEITLAETDKRTADAYCTEATSLVFFLKQDLEEWIAYEPRLGAHFLMNLSSVLAKRLFQANRLIARL